MTNEITQPTPQDRLNRGPYLEGLMKFIFRLDKGVIAIDGEWGVGKTWFGKNLKEKLDNQGSFKTIWLDVFESDWSDDPAISLIAGIAAQLDAEKSKNFLTRVAPILGAILPLAAKAAIKAAANYVGIGEELATEVSDESKKEARKFIQKHLEAAKDKQHNLNQLKQLLNETVKENAGKLVIFVDELDRCSPGYAVRFLERLKHLFDLEGVVYVLLWNREQVQKTVEVFYGTGSNGQMYLDKFIDYPLHIPISQINSRENYPLTELIESITLMVDGKERPNKEQQRININAYFIAHIAHILGMTARETIRLAAWWAISANRPLPLIDTWLLGLKVKHPDTFAGLRSGNIESHTKARMLLEQVQQEELDYPEPLMALIELHSRFINQNFKDFPQKALEYIVGRGAEPESAIKASVRRLEFDFE